MTKKKKRECTVPVQDLGIKSIPTPDETYAYFQTKGRYMSTGSDESLDNAGPDGQMFTRGNAPEFALPVHTGPDRQHGPVKVYTKEEVAEYNRQRQRDWIEELDNE